MGNTGGKQIWLSNVGGELVQHVSSVSSALKGDNHIIDRLSLVSIRVRSGSCWRNFLPYRDGWRVHLNELYTYNNEHEMAPTRDNEHRKDESIGC